MRLKIDENKLVEFEMDTAGVSEENLEGFFRLTIEGIEYGFPVSIKEGTISVDIPPLKNIINESFQGIKEATVNGRLDIIANKTTYLTPWKGEVDIDIPVSVSLSEKKTEAIPEKKEKTKDLGKEIKVLDPDIKEQFDQFLKQDKKVSKEEIKEEKMEEAKEVKSNRLRDLLDGKIAVIIEDVEEEVIEEEEIEIEEEEKEAVKVSKLKRIMGE